MSKKSIYVLLPAVVLLWAYIGWQVYQQVKEPELPVPEFIPLKKSTVDKENLVPFVLTLNYKDPFLRAVSGGHSSREQSEKKKGKSSIGSRRRMPWPKVTYRGWIENHKKTIGLLQINNKQHLVDEGHDYDGVYVEKLYQDSIRIKKNNEVKSFVKT